jgi:hypothetical protein
MLLRRSWTASLVITVACAVVVMAAGCRKTQNTDSNSPSTTAHASSSAPVLTAGSGSARVTYRPNVKVLAQEEGTNAIEGVSTNGAGLLLDASNTNLRSLTAGDAKTIEIERNVTVGAGEEVPVDSLLTGFSDVKHIELNSRNLCRRHELAAHGRRDLHRHSSVALAMETGFFGNFTC